MKKVIAAALVMMMMLTLGTTAFAVNAPLSVEQAKQAALDFAGVNASDANFTIVHRDYDHGREVFEIEFYANNTEYDMDVEVNTGRITDFSTEYHGMQSASGYGYWDDDMFERDRDWDDMFDWDHDYDHDWDDAWDFD